MPTLLAHFQLRSQRHSSRPHVSAVRKPLSFWTDEIAAAKTFPIDPSQMSAASNFDVRFGPKADINDMPGCAATAGERDGSGSAFAPRLQRRSTGWDCRSHDCPPKYCLFDSSLRTSDTGSPNSRPRSPHTTEPRRPSPGVAQRSKQQEQRR